MAKDRDVNDILRDEGEEAVRALHDAAERFDESNPKFRNGKANGSHARFNGKAARSPSNTPDPSANGHTGESNNDDTDATRDDAPLLIRTSKQFVANFVAPDYIVDGLLQEGFLYSLTGATGAGKTAITLGLAASVALGIVFAGRETKRRRVLYLAAENPDDVRMRWIALSQHMHFDIDAIEVFFVEGVF